jgi:hypothetical protein
VPVLVNPAGKLGTASAAAFAHQSSDAALRAHVRRQDKEIAALKREVSRHSRR